MLTEDEREWIVRGMAWVALRRWLCGPGEADQARAWFNEQMDLRFEAKQAGRYITPDMERLESEVRGRVLAEAWAGGAVVVPDAAVRLASSRSGRGVPGNGPR